MKVLPESFRGTAIASIEAGHGIPAPGGYNGLSGAPIVDGKGSLLGGVGFFVRPGGEGAPAGVIPFSDLMFSMASGRMMGTRQEDSVIVGRSEVVPGKLIGVTEIWGSLMKGVVGTVTMQRDAEIVALAHAYTRDQSGQRVYAIANCSPLAIVPRGRVYNVVAGTPSKIEGVITYDGSGGVYGVLGQPVPAVHISVEVRARGIEYIYNRQYHVAVDEVTVRNNTLEAIAHGLHNSDYLLCSRRAVVTAEVGDLSDGPSTFVSLRAELPERIAEYVSLVIGDVPLEDGVEVNIRILTE